MRVSSWTCGGARRLSFGFIVHCFMSRLKLIGSTTTAQGPEVHAWLDQEQYKKGRKVTAAEFDEVCIKRNKFQGDWNYEIHPRK